MLSGGLISNTGNLGYHSTTPVQGGFFVRYRLLLATLFAALSLPTAAPAQNWQQGPVGNPHDLTPSAVSKGQFATGSRLLSDDATIFIACKGVDNSIPVLELRFLVKPFVGFNPSTIPKTAVIHIDGGSHPVSLDSFLLQNTAFFVAGADAAGAKQIASVEHGRSSTLSIDFLSTGRKFSFITTLGEPSAPVARVLKACNVAIPAPPLPPAVATSSEMDKYTFMGIHLGMTAQQALAVEKAIATTPIKPGPGGGVDFETAHFYFISVSPDDRGLIEFYKVCGKTSKAAKAGPKSGPLYDAAVKAFGPVTGKPPSSQTWVQWDKSGGVDARYEQDNDEEPGGCVFVTKATQ